MCRNIFVQWKISSSRTHQVFVPHLAKSPQVALWIIIGRVHFKLGKKMVCHNNLGQQYFTLCTFVIWFNWNFFPRIQLTLSHHWFRQWFGTVYASSHCLYLWRPSLLIHIRVTRPRWINSSPPSAAYMRQWTGSSLVHVMACCLFATKPLSKPMLGYYQLDPWEQTSVNFKSKFKTFH